MKLLLDHNLSPRLTAKLVDIFPDIIHVAQASLDRATDGEVWQYAKENKLVILTKDSDFNDLATMFSFPPKLIWLRAGNCTTDQLEKIIRINEKAIKQFGGDSSTGLLILL